MMGRFEIGLTPDQYDAARGAGIQLEPPKRSRQPAD